MRKSRREYRNASCSQAVGKGDCSREISAGGSRAGRRIGAGGWLGTWREAAETIIQSSGIIALYGDGDDDGDWRYPGAVAVRSPIGVNERSDGLRLSNAWVGFRSWWGQRPRRLFAAADATAVIGRKHQPESEPDSSGEQPENQIAATNRLNPPLEFGFLATGLA